MSNLFINRETNQIILTKDENLASSLIGFIPENINNKSINLDNPDNEKYPTTLAISNALNSINDALSIINGLLNNKQDILNFNPENITNKATTLINPDNTKYPTTLAVSSVLSGYQLNLGFIPENSINKENNIIDNNINKYPTVSLLKTGLDNKVNNSQISINTNQIAFASSNNNLIGDNAFVLDANRTLQINKPAQNLTREYLLQAKLSDGGNSLFFIANGTANNNFFIPVFGVYFDTTNSNTSCVFRGFISSVNDVSNSVPIQSFQSLITSSSTDPNNGTLSSVINRPLFGFQNLTSYVMLISPNGSTKIGSNTLAAAQLDINNALGSQPILKLNSHSQQSTNLLEFRDSSNNLLSCFLANSSLRLISLTDANANNNSLYFSSTQNKLCFKDSNGIVNPLY